MSRSSGGLFVAAWGLPALLGGGGILGLVAGAYTGCQQIGTGGGTGNQNPAGPALVLGGSIGLTGDLSGNTRALKGGLLVAEAQINAGGGVLGRQITFQIEDDASDPSVAATVANDFLRAGVHGVIGPGASSQVANAYPIYGGQSIVELSSTATSPTLTASFQPKQGYFFRTVPADQLQGKAIVQFALRGPLGADGGGAGACHKLALVHNDDTYGNSMDQVIEPYMTMKGGTVCSTPGCNPVAIKIPADVQPSYATEAAQIIAAQPDCVAVVTFAPAGDQFVKDMTAAIQADTSGHNWKNFFFIGSDGCYDPLFIQNGRVNPADPNSMSWVQGVFGTNADSNPPDRVQYNDFKNLYTSQIPLAPDQNGDLDPYTANEYDGAILLALAIQAAGPTLSPDGIRNSLFDVSRGKNPGAHSYGPADVPDAIAALRRGEDINYNGASGDVDFDDYGDVIADFIVWEVQGQAFVVHDRVKAADLK